MCAKDPGYRRGRILPALFRTCFKKNVLIIMQILTAHRMCTMFKRLNRSFQHSSPPLSAPLTCSRRSQLQLFLSGTQGRAEGHGCAVGWGVAIFHRTGPCYKYCLQPSACGAAFYATGMCDGLDRANRWTNVKRRERVSQEKIVQHAFKCWTP